jgi:hypothetical protein
LGTRDGTNISAVNEENMARKIRILQLVNGFAIGGGEIKLLDLVKGLNRNNRFWLWLFLFLTLIYD